MSNDPKWLTRARWYNGVVETKGPQHNPKIMHLLDVADGKDDGKNLQGIRDDETPWCATFVSGVLEEVGIQSMRSAWARSYLKFGTKLSGPAVGAIVVFERGPTSGHVGFVVGKDASGNIVVLGGNQGDMVKLSPFALRRVLDYRWPSDEPLPVVGMAKLPVVKIGGGLSSNEA
jgi:uncharacterized protein (TIGR02594 family)